MKNQYKSHLVALFIIATAAGFAGAADNFSEAVAPRAIEIVEPEVPVNLIRWGLKGEVEVAFKINEDGLTENVVVLSATHKKFGDSARDAVRKWKFTKPAVEGVEYHVPFRFK